MSHFPQLSSVVGLCLSLSVGIVIGYTFAHTKRAATHKPEVRKDACREVDHPSQSYRRLRRAETVLRDRIGSVAIVLERTSSSHNFAAVLRTAEALGYQEIYLVSVLGTVANLENAKMKAQQMKKKQKTNSSSQWVQDDVELAAHLGIAQGASKWVTLHHFESAVDAIEHFKSNGYTIWATDLSQKAETLGFDESASFGPKKVLPNKLALVMGTETSGISQLFLDAADRRVFLPMFGFADSFNLSVGCAMVMQQLLFMDPSILGSLDESERRRLRARWYAQLARTPQELQEFESLLDNPPPPFRDTRRSDEHRAPHCRPGDLAKMVNSHEYTIGR